MKSQNRAILRVAVAAALSCPLAALAQEAPPPPEESAQAPAEEVVGLEEIVITAQKRQQSLQDVPLSVSAFSGDMLKDGRMLDVRAIVGFTPGFSGNTEDGFTDALSMRGISTNDFGIGGDPSVAMFVDGFWAGRTGGVMTAMYDIERTEVVKGPQGTLFGRNSIAGAVSVITKKPEPDFAASAELTLADWDHVEANAMVNVPLGDQWALRVAGYVLDNKGFLKNDQGGDELGFHQISAGRVSLARDGDNFDATLTAAYEDREQDPSVYWVPAAGLPKERVNTDLADNGIDESNVFDLHATLEWAFAGDYSLTSLTGYKKFNFRYLEDYDGGPEYVNNYGQENDVEYWSQEFRLNSPSSGKVTWFAGASLYEEKIDGIFDYLYDEDALCRALCVTEAPDFNGPAAGCDDPNFEAYWGDDIDPADILHDKSERSRVHVKSQGWAVYGDFTWAISDRFDIDGGRALHLRQEGNVGPGLRQRRRARQQLQLRVLHERRGQGLGQLGRIHAAHRALVPGQRRRESLRDGLARLQVRRLRDLRLRPARPGYQ